MQSSNNLYFSLLSLGTSLTLFIYYNFNICIFSNNLVIHILFIFYNYKNNKKVVIGNFVNFVYLLIISFNSLNNPFILFCISSILFNLSSFNLSSLNLDGWDIILEGNKISCLNNFISDLSGVLFNLDSGIS